LEDAGPLVKRRTKWDLIFPGIKLNMGAMSTKKERMRIFAETFTECGSWDPRYWGYFKTFNEGRFYEAHDVLEDLWLECRDTPLDTFYKSLIQLAGAFVHLENKRERPSLALFNLCQGYLKPFGDHCEGLPLTEIHQLIDTWKTRIQTQSIESAHQLLLQHKPLLELPG
jgi:predicted metal-dependent hydrolase